MPISHENKFIFVHITKTGGSSMEKALGLLKKNELYGFEDENGNFYNCKKAIKLNASKQDKEKLLCLQHLKAREIKERYDPEVWNNYFKFAFVRNPWDRLVSDYSYKMQKRKDLIRAYGLNKKSSLEDYVYAIKDRDKIILQKDFVTDEKGNVIIDFIGRFENMEDDFEKICNKIGFTSKLKKTNKSSHKDYKYYYDEKLKKIVHELYKDDIELFNYSF